MFIIRNDDVLTKSGTYSDPVARFKQQHRAIRAVGIQHIPAIITNGLSEFPEAIEYIKNETYAGLMKPAIHCRNHKTENYRPVQSVQFYKDLLNECRDWIVDNIDYTPTLWATPWGGMHPQQIEAAESLGLKIEGTQSTIDLSGIDGVLNSLKTGVKNLSDFENKTLLVHWWQAGLRVQRFCEVVKEGSWKAAETQNPFLFK